MNQRTRKKTHKRLINDFAYELAFEDTWRKKLFAADYNQKFTLSKNDHDIKDKDLRSLLHRYDLEFNVLKIYPNQVEDLVEVWFEPNEFKIEGDKFFLKNMKEELQEIVFFAVESKEFPEISSITANGLDIFGDK